MSVRKAIMVALKAALATAAPDIPVTHWRDCAATRGAATNIKDIESIVTVVGAHQQHALRVHVDSQVVAEELGEAMSDELDRLIRIVGDATTFTGVPGFLLKTLEGTTCDPAGEGMDTGIVKLVLTFTYRVRTWSEA